jgi:hypothetical protein
MASDNDIQQRLVQLHQRPATVLNHVRMVGSDSRMDQAGNFNVPANAWPVRCTYCTFPDIDSVPRPYWLAKGVTTPGDFAQAELGNFLVRARARSVLEVVVPDNCRFYPTHNRKTKEETDWFLAVPNCLVRTAKVSAKVPRCPECGEPKLAHPGMHFEQCPVEAVSAEIFKSLRWGSYEKTGEQARWYWMHILLLKAPPQTPPHRWTRILLDRELWFSRRLAALLKVLRLRGLCVFIDCDEKPTAAGRAWVEEQVDKLRQLGLLEATPEGTSGRSASWFENYLLKHKAKKAPRVDPEAWEKEQGIALSPDYKRLLRTVGRKTFRNIDGEEGFDVRLLLLRELDAAGYRRGCIEGETEVDGLMFAVAIDGDCFCFDLAAPGPDYPVVHFLHEGMFFEPYASSFVECLRRFAGE